MKKPFSSGTRAFAIIVSILLSCLIWVYVNNDETVSVNVDGVRVEFLNAETTLANRGLVLVGGDDATVDLVLSMPRRTVLRFDPAKVRTMSDERLNLRKDRATAFDHTGNAGSRTILRSS